MNKKSFLILGTLIVVGAGVATSSMVFANGTSGQTPISSLVQKIADKFGLNKDDVQKVFDDEKQSRLADIETRHDDELSQLVKDNKITEQQKSLILAKHKELSDKFKSEKGSFKNLSATDRQAKRKSEVTDLQNWAKDNGIDLKYLMGGGFRGGFGWRHMDRDID